MGIKVLSENPPFKTLNSEELTRAFEEAKEVEERRGAFYRNLRGADRERNGVTGKEKAVTFL